MNSRNEKLLDAIGRKILAVLQENARAPLSRIGQRVGLSAPAVAERVRKLEEAGLIRGYHARLDPSLLGRPVAAFIQLQTDTRHYPAVKTLAARLPAVIACHHISGDASFMLHVCVAAVADLESVVARFSAFGRTQTAIVLSTAVDKRDRLPLKDDA